MAFLVPQLILGSLADIVAALAACAGSLLAWRALKLAREANVTAEAVRKEANEASSSVLMREAERDRRDIASQLQAWWVARDATAPGEKPQFGVLLSNAGAGSTVFQDVEIEAEGNHHPGAKAIRMKTVPPGTYFIQSNRTGDSSAWAMPEVVEDVHSCLPLTRAERYWVGRIRFTDPLGTAWEWSRERGLSSAGSPQD